MDDQDLKAAQDLANQLGFSALRTIKVQTSFDGRKVCKKCGNAFRSNGWYNGRRRWCSGCDLITTHCKCEPLKNPYPFVLKGFRKSRKLP